MGGNFSFSKLSHRAGKVLFVTWFIVAKRSVKEIWMFVSRAWERKEEKKKREEKEKFFIPIAASLVNAIRRFQFPETFTHIFRRWKFFKETLTWLFVHKWHHIKCLFLSKSLSRSLSFQNELSHHSLRLTRRRLITQEMKFNENERASKWVVMWHEKREIKKRVDSFCCQNEAFTKHENLMTVLNKEREKNLLILEEKKVRE
jgi:hypothetical protein